MSDLFIERAAVAISDYADKADCVPSDVSSSVRSIITDVGTRKLEKRALFSAFWEQYAKTLPTFVNDVTLLVNPPADVCSSCNGIPKLFYIGSASSRIQGPYARGIKLTDLAEGLWMRQGSYPQVIIFDMAGVDIGSLISCLFVESLVTVISPAEQHDFWVNWADSHYAKNLAYFNCRLKEHYKVSPVNLYPPSSDISTTTYGIEALKSPEVPVVAAVS